MNKNNSPYNRSPFLYSVLLTHLSNTHVKANYQRVDAILHALKSMVPPSYRFVVKGGSRSLRSSDHALIVHFDYEGEVYSIEALQGRRCFNVCQLRHTDDCSSQAIAQLIANFLSWQKTSR